MSRFQQISQPFDVRFQVPHGTVFKHTQKGAPAQRCGGRDVGEVQETPATAALFQSRSCAATQHVQVNNGDHKSSSQRERQTLRGYLTRMSTKEHFQRVRVCILRIKISSTWLESLERFAQKRTIGCSPRCAAMKKAKRGMQTSFLCPVKQSCAQDEYCIPYICWSLRSCGTVSHIQGAFLSPNICRKQKKVLGWACECDCTQHWCSHCLTFFFKFYASDCPLLVGKSDMHHTFTAFVRK